MDAAIEQLAAHVADPEIRRRTTGTIDGRLIAEALPTVPPTIARMMEIVHTVAGDAEEADPRHDL